MDIPKFLFYNDDGLSVFYMKKLNGDEKIKVLENKIINNENLTGEDIIALTLMPLMSGNTTK